MVLDHNRQWRCRGASRVRGSDCNSNSHILTHTSTDHATQLIQHQPGWQGRRHCIQLHQVRHSGREGDRRVDVVERLHIVLKVRRRELEAVIVLNVAKHSVVTHTVGVTTVPTHAFSFSLLRAVRVRRVGRRVHAIPHSLHHRDHQVLVAVCLKSADHEHVQRRVDLLNTQLSARAVDGHPAGQRQRVVVRREQRPVPHVHARRDRRLQTEGVGRAIERLVGDRERERGRVLPVAVHGEGELSGAHMRGLLRLHRHAQRRTEVLQVRLPAVRTHALHRRRLRVVNRLASQLTCLRHLVLAQHTHLQNRRQRRRAVTHQTHVAHVLRAAVAERKRQGHRRIGGHICLPHGREVAVE